MKAQPKIKYNLGLFYAMIMWFVQNYDDKVSIEVLKSLADILDFIKSQK